MLLKKITLLFPLTIYYRNNKLQESKEKHHSENQRWLQLCVLLSALLN